MIRISKIIPKLIGKIGIDNITHFFARTTIALSITLILCFVDSISNVVPYSILETNVSVICSIVK